MLRQAKKIFLVGIGGMAISGLAKILKWQDLEVRGSDLAPSEITDELAKVGIPVFLGHNRENLPSGCDLLIYSAAVGEDNPERQRAKELQVRQLSYPQAVGELSRDYEKVIAVAGTNGKTTTTAMIGWILEQAGEDPTVLVGSKVLAWNSNARVGKSKKYFVVEADEYRRAFLNYEPDIAVITNIEADHLDYFEDLQDIKNAFEEFKGKMKPGGKIIEKYEFESFKLKVPGDFNLANASAAAAACRGLGISEETIQQALESFTGTWRRFELVASRFIGNKEIRIISDYAHHPTAIEMTLQTAFEVYRGKKILTVFQPHQHNRTKNLFQEFVKAFCESKLDDFIISEIFDVAGREEDKDKDISSRDLVLEISKCGKHVQYTSDLSDCEHQVRKVLNNYDVAIFMGAGDIYKVADKLVELPSPLSEREG